MPICTSRFAGGTIWCRVLEKDEQKGAQNGACVTLIENSIFALVIPNVDGPSSEMWSWWSGRVPFKSTLSEEQAHNLIHN